MAFSPRSGKVGKGRECLIVPLSVSESNRHRSRQMTCEASAAEEQGMLRDMNSFRQCETRRVCDALCLLQTAQVSLTLAVTGLGRGGTGCAML